MIGTGTPSLNLWSVLFTIWSSERIQRWEAFVLGDKATERTDNQMCLAPYVHMYWGQAMFALKPVEPSDNGMELVLEFHWLREGKVSDRVSMIEMPEFNTGYGSPVRDIWLWDYKGIDHIRSQDYHDMFLIFDFAGDDATIPLSKL